MVRLLVLYNTPNDTEAFERRYREVLVPLLKKMEGLRRLTLSRNAVPGPSGEPYYLVAELDWDDMATMQRALQSPEGQAAAPEAVHLSKLSPGTRSMMYELEDL